MGNVFYADFYRLRKSASFRNTIIGLIVLILFTACIFKFMSSEGLVIMLDEIAGEAISASEMEELKQDMEELRQIEQVASMNAAGFADEMLSSNFIAFLLLPMAITIFAADFTAGTVRNTLSYQSDRKKVYLAKFLLSIVSYFILTAICIAASWLIGGLLFGFSGITPSYLSRTLIAQLLFLPVQLGVLGFAHCIIAFTKKSSSTIAIYLLTLTFSSVILQLMQNFSFSVAGFPISLKWVSLLDWNAVGRLLLNYPTMRFAEILTAVVGGLAITAITTALGMAHYNRADIA